MFYRRKLILAVLQIFGGELEKIKLQKILFLVCNKQVEPEYEFIPYKFGCFSHSAKADLTTMVNKGQLSHDDIIYRKTDKKNYLSLLDENDKKLVNQVFVLYNKMSSDNLMKHTYVHFPYYAINSVKAKSLLNAQELLDIQRARPVNTTTTLYTIGYEGISLEGYLNKLLQHDIKLLIDVRNNPMSQKYGFSKTTLQRVCEGLAIEYMHMPEVGIKSEYRQELNNQSDYNELFATYKKKTIAETVASQQMILQQLREKKQIALTCFEADICQCHRKPLAEAIQALPGFKFDLKHI